MNDKVRLGYACVNMTLTNRPNKLGGRVTTSRTARKATWYPDRNYQLIGERALLNATDLLHYLKWHIRKILKVKYLEIFYTFPYLYQTNAMNKKKLSLNLT